MYVCNVKYNVSLDNIRPLRTVAYIQCFVIIFKLHQGYNAINIERKNLNNFINIKTLNSKADSKISVN